MVVGGGERSGFMKAALVSDMLVERLCVFGARSYGETSLRVRLKSLGGRWSPAEKLWHVSYGAIRGIAELEERIV